MRHCSSLVDVKSYGIIWVTYKLLGRTDVCWRQMFIMSNFNGCHVRHGTSWTLLKHVKYIPNMFKFCIVYFKQLTFSRCSLLIAVHLIPLLTFHSLFISNQGSKYRALQFQLGRVRTRSAFSSPKPGHDSHFWHRFTWLAVDSAPTRASRPSKRWTWSRHPSRGQHRVKQKNSRDPLVLPVTCWARL